MYAYERRKNTQSHHEKKKKKIHCLSIVEIREKCMRVEPLPTRDSSQEI
jgi:hypothetical protein